MRRCTPGTVKVLQEILIRVHSIGVNPVETYIRAGGHGYSSIFPYTPGHDIAGVIEAVGEKVAPHFKPGEL